MGEINTVYKILGGKQRGRGDFINIGVDGWVILKWILTKEDLNVDRILVIQYRTRCRAIVNTLWSLRPSKSRYAAKRSLRFESLHLKSSHIFL